MQESHLLGHGGIEGLQDRQADDRAGLGRVSHDHRTLADRCPFRAMPSTAFDLEAVINRN